MTCIICNSNDHGDDDDDDDDDDDADEDDADSNSNNEQSINITYTYIYNMYRYTVVLAFMNIHTFGPTQPFEKRILLHLIGIDCEWALGCKGWFQCT